MDMLFIDSDVLNTSVIIGIKTDDTEEILLDLTSVFKNPTQEKIDRLMDMGSDYMLRQNRIVLRKTSCGFEINTHLEVEYLQEILENLLAEF